MALRNCSAVIPTTTKTIPGRDDRNISQREYEGAVVKYVEVTDRPDAETNVGAVVGVFVANTIAVLDGNAVGSK